MERTRTGLCLGALLVVGGGCPVPTTSDGLTLCYCDGECPIDAESCADQLAPTVLAGGQITRWQIFVPEDTASGKELEVTTSLGQLSPSSAMTGALTLRTRGEEPLPFSLYVDTTPGEGLLRVTGAGGLEATALFDVAELAPCLRLLSAPGDVCGDEGGSVGAEPDDGGLDPYEACVTRRGPVQFAASDGTLEFEVVLPGDDLHEPVAQNVRIESTLAPLRKQQSGVDAYSLEVAVVPGTRTRFLLDAGRTPGLGQLEASIGGQVAEVMAYEITNAEEDIVLGGEVPEIHDDMRSYDFQFTLLGSAIEGPQRIDFQSTLGRLSAEGPDEHRTSVLATPCEPFVVGLVADEGPGVGTLTAKIDGVVERPVSYSIEPISETLVFPVPPANDVYEADGVTVASIELESMSTRLADRPITVESLLGRVEPSDPSSPKSLVLTIGPNEKTLINLTLGREVGTEVLTAIDGGVIADSIQFHVARSRPDYLSLVGTPPVLTTAVTSATLTAYFGRSDERRVSLGTRIGFEACCPLGDPTDACAYVQIPAAAQATGEADVIDGVELSLTPAGAALVAQLGNPPSDDVPVTVYAYSPGPTTNEDLVDCGSLGLGIDLGFTAMDTRSFALQRQATIP